ncbi:hypothetical protein OROHE_005114 [Orobanche hederae]
MERRKKEEAERKAKLDEIAEKQRQRERELEEKGRQWKEEILAKSSASPLRTDVSAAAPSAQPTGKYVPRFKRVAADSGGPVPTPVQTPPETDKWSSGSRLDDRGDRWRDDRRAGPRPTWQSSRAR